MYFFFKKKGYDPAPYSYIKRWLHKRYGCTFSDYQPTLHRNLDPRTNKQFQFQIRQPCKCGVVYITDVRYPRN